MDPPVVKPLDLKDKNCVTLRRASDLPTPLVNMSATLPTPLTSAQGSLLVCLNLYINKGVPLQWVTPADPGLKTFN